MSSWSKRARYLVERAIADGRAAGLDGKALRRFVTGRYPWGLRENAPYRAWLRETAYQLSVPVDVSNYWHEMAYGRKGG